MSNCRILGSKTANIISKKRQSLLLSVVIGRRRPKTANITKGGEGMDKVMKRNRGIITCNTYDDIWRTVVYECSSPEEA